MPVITVNGTNLAIPPEITLHRELGKYGAAFFSCGGRGLCGKCKVTLISGNAELTDAERKLLTDAEIRAGVRLACFLPAIDGMVLEFVSAAPQILTDTAGAEFGANGAQGRNGYGIAIDLGTTTIAAYLADLETGRVLESRSALNRQKAFGDDVITRISYTIENPLGTETMRELTLEQLNSMLAGFPQREISAVVIAANTVMTHFLLGVSAAGIAAAPFTPAFTELITTDASRIPLTAAPNAEITVMPAISGYVGGDVVAGIFYTGLHKSEKLKLLIDLGTNGEIVLGSKERMCACSVAAGPAFEGGRLSCGTGGVEGAVDSFRIDSGKAVFTTIGGAEPIGLCGSGVIDIVASLVNEGIIDETGFMGEPYFLTENVYLSERDVREVQLAKAAVAAGIFCLLRHYGADASDVSEVYIAGGFGCYMREESALAVKMLPEAFRGRIRGIGNSSAGGALALLCGGAFGEVKEIKQKTEYLELSGHLLFQQRFIEEICF